MPAADASFLAGFVDAEGSFQITPRNGAQHWGCELSVKVRDDEADVISDLHRRLGVGRVTYLPAVRASKPQIQWRIGRRTECLHLSRLLREHPLHGRKRLEFEVWSRALLALEAGEYETVLPQAALELRTLRRYVKPMGDGARPTHAVSDAHFAGYFGGLFTGEGHLHLSQSGCRLVVKLRDDDLPLLESIAAWTGIGRVYRFPAYRTSRPSAGWTVYRRAELVAAVELLERCGLRGRKAREFAAWRTGALEFATAARVRRRRDHSKIAGACEALAAARAYTAPAGLRQSDPTDAVIRESALEALRVSARRLRGELTVPGYMLMRESHPHWPDRNTIVRTFGSWADALGAAGLEDRVSRRAVAAGRRRSRRAQFDPQKHAAVRHRLVEAVRDCASELGHRPTVAEFLKWRAAGRSDLPAGSTIYRYFPDGWASVLAAAGLASDGSGDATACARSSLQQR